MDNKPSTSCECDDSGNVYFTIEDSKTTIYAQPQVNKQTTVNNYYQAGTTNEPRKESKNCCKIFDIKGNKQCEVLKAKLQAFYMTLTLPKVAWIDEGFELSLEKHFVQLQLSGSGKFIEIEETFHTVNNKKPHRILIEGQPGYGKTTLATKLAFDWATNKEYIDFKLAFFIPLRELKQQTIENAIMKIGERCGYLQQERINIKQILARHEEEILFIMDGLDELLLNGRYEAMKVLYKQMYSDSTVLTLCRTGLFKLTKPEHDELFGQTNKSHVFYDKRLTILGIQSIDRKLEFLKKFIPEENVNGIIQRLSSQLELFNSPLFLMMLPTIMDEDKSIGHFASKTDLYMKLFNSILRHTCIKRGIDIDKDFDLFDFNLSPNRIHEQMTQFGKLCIQKLLINDLKFDPNNLTTEIYQLGLLINHKQVTFFTSKHHYEAYHLSIVEFAAAFALSIGLKSKKSALAEGTLESIVDHFLESRGTSLTMPFLASLMGIHLDLLLVKIQSFSAWFCLNNALAVQLIAECSPINISNSKHLRSFIPSHVNLLLLHSVFTSNLSACKNLLQYGCDCGKIKQLTIKQRVPSQLFSNNLPTRFQIIISLNVARLTMYTKFSANLQQIFSYPISGTLKECFRFATSPNIESCALEIESDYTELAYSAQIMETLMKEKIFNKIKYCYVQIDIRNELEKQFAISLLENNQVQYLKVSGTYNQGIDGVSDLLSAAAQSSNLTSLSLNGIVIDLYDITNGGTKTFDFIDIGICSATKQNMSLKNCFKNVRLRKSENIVPITEMEPIKFACTAVAIKNLIEKCPTWVGFNSVKYLQVSLAAAIKYRRIFLGVWTNLQTLHLQFEIDFNRLNYEEMVADSIQSLPIVKLVVEKEGGAALNLFQHMNCLWANGSNSNLKTIEFVCCRRDTFSEELLELIKGLECGHWDKVNLISDMLELSDIKQYLFNFDVSQLDYVFNFNPLEVPHPFEYVPYYPHILALSISRKS